jgi:hypothetical protein
MHDSMAFSAERFRFNSVLPKLAVTCKIEAVCYYQTIVQFDNEVLRNRQLRQHAKRYLQGLKKTIDYE